MSRRVLIVTSSYAPAMIADMQRARHLAWELPNTGWDVEVLCPDSTYQPPSCLDRDSVEFFSPDTVTHFVPQYLPRLLRSLGLGSIGWRAILPMFVAGLRLLRSRRFDLVYLTTAQFPLFLLGPAWRRLSGVSFALDIHDPCYKEGIATPMWARPGVKHSVSRWLAKRVESLSVRAAAGLIAVSPEYIEMLQRRFERLRPRWMAADRHAVIPFSVLYRDFEVVSSESRLVRSAPSARTTRVVYVGAGGPVMARSFDLICRALAYLRQQDPVLLQSLTIELYGTMLGWREGDPSHLADIARKHGIDDLVREDPRRVTYRRSMELLLESDGALILGVDDSGYMPSKLFAYSASGKPLLAALRRGSPAFVHLAEAPALGHLVWFDGKEEIPLREAAHIMKTFVFEAANRQIFDRGASVAPYTASVMALKHVEVFGACLAPEMSRERWAAAGREVAGEIKRPTA